MERIFDMNIAAALYRGLDGVVIRENHNVQVQQHQTGLGRRIDLEGDTFFGSERQVVVPHLQHPLPAQRSCGRINGV